MGGGDEEKKIVWRNHRRNRTSTSKSHVCSSVALCIVCVNLVYFLSPFIDVCILEGINFYIKARPVESITWLYERKNGYKVEWNEWADRMSREEPMRMLLWESSCFKFGLMFMMFSTAQLLISLLLLLLCHECVLQLSSCLWIHGCCNMCFFGIFFLLSFMRYFSSSFFITHRKEAHEHSFTYTTLQPIQLFLQGEKHTHNCCAGWLDRDQIKPNHGWPIFSFYPAIHPSIRRR